MGPEHLALRLQGLAHVAVALSIVLGGINCFFGYRYFKLTLVITGFVLGAAASGQLFANADRTAILFAILLGAILGALLAFPLYLVGVFCAGYALGAGVTYLVMGDLDPYVLWPTGILCGIIAVLFQKLIIILYTSLGGATAIVLGVLYFVDPSHVPPFRPPPFKSYAPSTLALIIGCWLVLSVAGIVVQYTAVDKTKLGEGADEEETSDAHAGGG